MTKVDAKEYSKIANEGIKRSIKQKDRDKLLGFLDVAQKHGAHKKTIFSGWICVGDLFEKDELYVESIEAFSKARHLYPSNGRAVKSLLGAFNKFCNLHYFEFSKEDLTKLIDAIQPLANYIEVTEIDLNIPIEHELKIIQEIKFRREDAPSKIETKLSFRVNKIYNALYGEMTPEEVRQEFARIAFPIITRIYKEETVKTDNPPPTPDPNQLTPDKE